jgi:hypothetical protein
MSRAALELYATTPDEIMLALCEQGVLVDAGVSRIVNGLNIGLSTFAADMSECEFGRNGRKQFMREDKWPTMPDTLTEEYTTIGKVWTWDTIHI